MLHAPVLYESLQTFFFFLFSKIRNERCLTWFMNLRWSIFLFLLNQYVCTTDNQWLFYLYCFCYLHHVDFTVYRMSQFSCIIMRWAIFIFFFFTITKLFLWEIIKWKIYIRGKIGFASEQVYLLFCIWMRHHFWFHVTRYLQRCK